MVMVNPEELRAGFGALGLAPGDTVIVHSSYKSLGGVAGGAERVIGTFLELVGPDGTVLFPTFNFQSWTETHYFDIYETPGMMGVIGELARARPDAVRTPHPIYSFAALGGNCAAFGRCDDVEAFGDDSVFGLFHRLNGMIVSIGLDFNNTFSFHHYVEYKTGCDYRRVKRFSGIYVGRDGKPEVRTYSMFVRKNLRVKTYIVPGMNDLLTGGVIREVGVGEARVHFARAVDFFDHMSAIVREQPEKLHSMEGPRP
jgi:aminoglycoside 3-N-acetyltransferase